MIIVRYRNIFFALTGIIVALSLGLFFVFGLNIGTDFTGGTLIEARYEGTRPSTDELSAALEKSGLKGYSIRGAGEDAYIVRAESLTNEVRAALPMAVSLDGTYKANIERLTDIGPTIGAELRTKALLALTLVILCIVLYVAFVFRKVSEPISSWAYGFITILTLIHDVIVPVGAFALFGYLWGAPVDVLFVTAVLTILGFSVHDTIVVFDRVRENLRINQDTHKKEDFELVVGRSIEQTFVRSINTSVTVLISLGALFFLGPEATQDFALTLIVGIIAGAYSSVVFATPLLVSYERWKAAR
ncbi:MAG: protein translocase subunit SecF [Minisyncoccia bacterium]